MYIEMNHVSGRVEEKGVSIGRLGKCLKYLFGLGKFRSKHCQGRFLNYFQKGLVATDSFPDFDNIIHKMEWMN